MAISVSGLTVHTQVGGGTWQNYGSGGGSGLTTATFLSSTSAQGRKFTGAKGFAYQVNASGTDLSSSIIVVRMLINGGLAATLAGGGASIRMEDTSGNTSDWYVAGSDTYNGGWLEAVIDTANAESANSGTAATLTAIQYVGILVNAASSSGGDPNVYVDEVLSMPNTGLTLAGNTANLFDEFATWDETSLYGVVSRRSGVVYIKCPITLSPDASNHASTDEVVVFEEPVYEDGTNVDSALTLQGMSSADVDTITLTRLNARCDNNGDIGGTHADKALDLASATDVVADTCVFDGFDGTTMALGGTGNSYDDCSFQRCAQITDTGAVVRRGFVRDTAAVATESALLWTTSSDWEDTTFVMGAGDSHAMEIETSITDNWTGFTFTGYSTTSTGTTVGDEVLNNNSTGLVTINATSITGVISYYDRGAGASTDIVLSPVTATITVLDNDDKLPVQNVFVTLWASGSAGGPFDPATVTITQAAGTATVTHTAHGMDTGDEVRITDAVESEYNGLHTITVTTANAYTYTVDAGAASPATGTITSSLLLINGLTDANGEAASTAKPYTGNQAFTGEAKKGTSSPVYVPGSITGEMDSAAGAGVSLTIVRDE